MPHTHDTFAADASARDLAALQGTWEQVDFEENGVANPPDIHGAPGAITVIRGQGVLQAGKKNVNIIHIEPVGNYAIQLNFSDGHNTGLYSWDLLYDYGVHQEEMWERYLRRLGEAGATREPVDSKEPFPQ